MKLEITIGLLILAQILNSEVFGLSLLCMLLVKPVAKLLQAAAEGGVL